ncbi:MAG: VWA domain-containing protein, partial [Huintestinicola sp.]
LTSEINTDNKTVSAHIDRSGIYALCDTAVLMQKKQTNIFFLIDNSGSMYPDELCANSEENDVEFKRLDFATNLIDMLGAEANYGAAEFSGNYTPIISINSNLDNTKNVISDIRNKDQVFSGTNIAGAITNAVKEFGASKHTDKNYLILLTDGIPSTYDEGAEKAAVQNAIDNNITIFTIGLGKYIDADYLLDIATKTNGQFFQASNADALSNIYEKIQHFMSYNQITIDGTSGQRGFIIADCGFNAQRDGLGYVNFRTEFAPNGADVGIAGLIRAYYTGELQLSAGSYQCSDGTSVEGYDVSGIEEFRDGKVDLKNIEIASLTAYNKYLNNPSKWDFGKISGGVLHFTDEMTDTIMGSGLKIYTAPYKYVAPEETVLEKTLRTIPFRNLKEFNEYDCVLIDSTGFSGNDSAVMGMIRWYCSVPKSDKCVTYDFAYQGQDAFDMLINELTTGSPAVITVGGSAMNAVRLVRDVEDPNSFVLDAYDSNSPDRLTKVYITRNPIYDGGQITSFQYCASRGGSTNEPFTIIVSK